MNYFIYSFFVDLILFCFVLLNQIIWIIFFAVVVITAIWLWINSPHTKELNPISKPRKRKRSEDVSHEIDLSIRLSPKSYSVMATKSTVK